MREWHETIREMLKFGRAWIGHSRKSERTRLDTGRAPSSIETGEQIFYEHAVRALDWQLRSGDALDLKIATWFTLVTVLLPVVAALLGAEHSRLGGRAGATAISFALGGAVVWIAVVSLLYSAYLPNQWQVGPDWDEFERAAQTHSPRSVYLANGTFIVHNAIPRNEKLLRKKARRLTWAVRLFGLEFVLFAVSVTISLR
jgi:hypothetical protein